MSKLTIDTTDLTDEGLEIETVNLEASNLETESPIELEGGELEVGIGGQSITVDDHLSHTSENPVQNKVLTLALDGKVDEESALTNLEIEALLR